MQTRFPLEIDVLVDLWKDYLNNVRLEATFAARHWTYAFLKQTRKFNESTLDGIE